MARGTPGAQELLVRQGGASRRSPKQHVDEGAVNWGLAVAFHQR
jgi:hypothetical protein